MEKKKSDNKTIENEILKNIKIAVEKIEKKFYSIISINGEERIRERVFCYELYHQLRLIEFNYKFDIHGELVKAGFYNINVIPDFLFHKQGSDDNYCIMEVKGELDSNGIYKDFKTLSKFLGKQKEIKAYKLAIFLLFNQSLEAFINFLKRNGKVTNLDKYSEKIIILCKKDKNSEIETCTLGEIKNQL
jgi:hypothetical protein